jgi:hypothetical protein
MLEHGADASRKTDTNTTAYTLALAMDNKSITKVILSAYAKKASHLQQFALLGHHPSSEPLKPAPLPSSDVKSEKKH